MKNKNVSVFKLVLFHAASPNTTFPHRTISYLRLPAKTKKKKKTLGIFFFLKDVLGKKKISKTEKL